VWVFRHFVCAFQCEPLASLASDKAADEADTSGQSQSASVVSTAHAAGQGRAGQAKAISRGRPSLCSHPGFFFFFLALAFGLPGSGRLVLLLTSTAGRPTAHSQAVVAASSFQNSPAVTARTTDNDGVRLSITQPTEGPHCAAYPPALGVASRMAFFLHYLCTTYLPAQVPRYLGTRVIHPHCSPPTYKQLTKST
jgi:hypothetical protein